MRDLEVAPEHDGLRLDMFLAAVLPDRSRSAIQKLIKDGHVTAPAGRGKPIRASTAVQAPEAWLVFSTAAAPSSRR